MLDISIQLDPVAWALEILVIGILLKWFKFEKKEMKDE